MSTLPLHHVAIKVADFEASVRFYKTLGFSEKVRWGKDAGSAVYLDSGNGVLLEIFAGGPPREKLHAWGQGAAVIHLCLRSDDVDAATLRAQQAGATVTLTPREVTIEAHDGRRIPVYLSFVQAPGGEVIEFIRFPPGQP